MSIVVALKYKDGVMLGGDRQFTYKGRVNIGAAQKVFPSKYSQTAMGIVGALRGIDLLSTNMVDLIKPQDILDEVVLNKDYVVNNIVTRIFEILTKFKCIDSENTYTCMDNSLIVIDGNKIFTIFSDGSVLESDKYACVGCGDEMAWGYLNNITINNKNITEEQCIYYIKNSINKACQNDVYIGNGIDILKITNEGGLKWIVG